MINTEIYENKVEVNMSLAAKQLNRDNAASLIRGALAIQRRKQIDLAHKLGINRVVLNMFLNRKLDLLPKQIEVILDELKIKNTFDGLEINKCGHAEVKSKNATKRRKK